MTYRLNTTPAAIADIEELRAYVATNSEQAADRFDHLLEQALEGLAYLPNRHPKAPEARTNHRDIRHAIVGSYRILFCVTDDVVHILRVRHGSRLPFKPGELS